MAHPINTLLEKTASGHTPTLKEIAGLGLPAENRSELEAAVADVERKSATRCRLPVADVERHGDEQKAAHAAGRLISRLPSGFEGDNYLDGDDLDPRVLAARLPQT